jgi:SAM-dependent methyltransferase
MAIQNHSLSVIIISSKGFSIWSELLPRVHSTLETLQLSYEVLVAAAELSKRDYRFIEESGCTVISSIEHYGTMLHTAVRQATGDYILTMDAGRAPSLDFICNLWERRGTAEILIGSRYIQGGAADMPVFRRFVSRVLNLVLSRGLDLRIHDMSSGFRLYNGQIVKSLPLESRDYDILQEILVQALMMGYRITETPFHYRSDDPSYLRVLHFGWAYARTFARLWKQRNSIASADYDARAYDALMPPQRYWQRQRYKIITTLINANGQERCVDVGCGSSRIVGALPKGSLVLDILLRKLRYVRRFGHPAVQGSIFNLPVSSETFPCVLCSQVIEHVPRTNVLDELDRVLQPGGLLILGTPDYGNWQWLVIEWLYKVLLPQAYADEHITHYTYDELVHEFVSKRGYKLEAAKYILRGELILGLRKPSR